MDETYRPINREPMYMEKLPEWTKMLDPIEFYEYMSEFEVYKPIKKEQKDEQDSDIDKRER